MATRKKQTSEAAVREITRQNVAGTQATLSIVVKVESGGGSQGEGALFEVVDVDGERHQENCLHGCDVAPHFRSSLIE